ncbi:hypothetical protein VTN02DRAFT_1514 [Thermoascus thermophilus]
MAGHNKEAFFKKLDDLDNLSDHSSEKNCNNNKENDFAHTIKLARKKEPTESARASTSKSFPPANPVRTQSAPQPSLRRVASDEVVVIKETPYQKSGKDLDEAGMKRPRTSGGHPENGRDGTATSKKRRVDSLKMVPEPQQIFKGLTFFFFPNNDVAPARWLRIQKAQEYGALWTKDWGDNITHVIVDKDLLFQDVLKFLKLDHLPPNVSVVNEDYPAECIKFRSLLSVAYSRFRVNGTQAAPDVEDPPADRSSDASLQFKSPRGQAHCTPSPSQNADNSKQTLPVHNVDGENSKEAEAATVSEPQVGRERDALDDLMEDLKAVEDLPLDPSDDEEGTVDSGSESPAASDSETEKPMKESRRGNTDQEVPAWQRNFSCMQKHDGKSSSDNPNNRTIEVLQKMVDYYTRTADHWRTLAYRKAIAALRRQKTKIATKAQAIAIPGIGERLAAKIEEIVCTNRLRRLENTSLTPEDQLLQLFLGVYGAGFSQASKWIAQGYRSLEDLRTKADLTKNQRIGVERYDDFRQRIPRAEVKEHGEFVRKIVQKVDPGMQVIIAGSYRRGAADSGDIDLLITKPDATMEQIRSTMMEIVIPELFKQGFLQVGPATTSRGDGSKWHGASALPGSNIWRRIDLLFVPGEQIGAALLYFTGNDVFNRSMRLLANRKGMCLNQRGLYKDILRGQDRVKMNSGCLLEGRDERRIFEILGVPWRPPEHRIC